MSNEEKFLDKVEVLCSVSHPLPQRLLLLTVALVGLISGVRGSCLFIFGAE